MARCTQPPIPLPPPLRGAEVGTFTHYSVATRLPDIARRVLAENDLPPASVAHIEALIADIPTAPIRPLDEPLAPDAADWACYIAPYLGQDWLAVPWFFAEMYFYRRLLEAIGAFRPGPGQGLDPFAYQKRQGLETTREAIRALSTRLGAGEWRPATFSSLLHVALWGNQADLSLWPAGRNEPPSHADLAAQQRHILVDETADIARRLWGDAHGPIPALRVDFLVDNAGFELVCDLALADALLTGGSAATVTLHVKAHPTFVSDATADDVHHTVIFLADDAARPVQALAERLHGHLEAGRLRLRPDPFWTSPLAAWEMPAALHNALAQAHLVISKGDAHYRRLLGDRHWPYTTPFADVVCYFPAPIAALRTCKSEVMLGLQSGQAEALARDDPAWETNGRWGMIQFAGLE